MTESAGRTTGEASGQPPAFLTRLGGILNSSLSVLLLGSLIGALGLFTWQRQDWIFKETFNRNQVLVDRRVNLIEKLDNDVGGLTAAVDSVSAALTKRVAQAQINTQVEAYQSTAGQMVCDNGVRPRIAHLLLSATTGRRRVRATDHGYERSGYPAVCIQPTG
ncbi:MAG: hypothetical protein H0X37_22160 [Herpetosiphonaceae bacterium]|nr:hypothetical protein [Herpetosiphonaceae bacterium]